MQTKNGKLPHYFLVNEKLCQKNEKKYTRDIFCWCCLGALLFRYRKEEKICWRRNWKRKSLAVSTKMRKKHEKNTFFCNNSQEEQIKKFPRQSFHQILLPSFSTILYYSYLFCSSLFYIHNRNMKIWLWEWNEGSFRYVNTYYASLDKREWSKML